MTDSDKDAVGRRTPPACSPRFLSGAELFTQTLAQIADSVDYGQNVTMDAGRIKWMRKAAANLKRERDEARAKAEEFRRYLTARITPDDAIPLFIPWENDPVEGREGDAPKSN